MSVTCIRVILLHRSDARHAWKIYKIHPVHSERGVCACVNNHVRLVYHGITMRSKHVRPDDSPCPVIAGDCTTTSNTRFETRTCVGQQLGPGDRRILSFNNTIVIDGYENENTYVARNTLVASLIANHGYARRSDAIPFSDETRRRVRRGPSSNCRYFRRFPRPNRNDYCRPNQDPESWQQRRCSTRTTYRILRYTRAAAAPRARRRVLQFPARQQHLSAKFLDGKMTVTDSAVTKRNTPPETGE